MNQESDRSKVLPPKGNLAWQAAANEEQPDADPSRPAKMKKWSLIVFVVAVVNFVAFFIGTEMLGGDAVNGKTEDGRYYVANHGKLTEVSHAAFTYSRIHCYTVFVTHPLAAIFGWLFYQETRRRKESGVRR